MGKRVKTDQLQKVSYLKDINSQLGSKIDYLNCANSFKIAKQPSKLRVSSAFELFFKSNIRGGEKEFVNHILGASFHLRANIFYYYFIRQHENQFLTMQL